MVQGNGFITIKRCAYTNIKYFYVKFEKNCYKKAALVESKFATAVDRLLVSAALVMFHLTPPGAFVAVGHRFRRHLVADGNGKGCVELSR